MAAAYFLGRDTSTQGTWKTVYGANGYSIHGVGASLPSGVSLSITGTSLTFESSTSDVSALQKPDPATDRIKSVWYNNSAFTLTLTIDSPKLVSLYCADYDSTSRRQTVAHPDHTEALTTDFSAGVWLKYLLLEGTHVFTLTRTAGANAVLSGVFFDTPDFSVYEDEIRRVRKAGIYVAAISSPRVRKAGIYTVHGPSRRRVLLAGVYVIEPEAAVVPPPTADTITAEQEGLRVRVTRTEPGTGGTKVILQRSTDAGETWVQIGGEYDPEITILYDDDPHVGSALYRTVLGSDSGATPSNKVEVVFDDEPDRPGTPTLTILGATLDTVLFETSGFFSPVGASGILAVAQVLDGDGEVIAEAVREIDADGNWLNAFVAGLTPPGAALTLRERHLDENGLYSHWSTPVPFTLETEEDEPVDPPEPPAPGSGGVVTALEFRSQWPGGTWGMHCLTFYPPELPIGRPDELGWPFLILTLRRGGSQLATRLYPATSLGSEPNGWTRKGFGKLRSNVEYVIDTHWTFGGLFPRKKTANRTIIFTTPRAPEAPYFRLPTVIHELTTVELYTDDFVGGVDGIELGTFTIEITFDGGQTWEILPDLREGASPGALLENLDTQDPASWSFPLDPSSWPKVTETRSPAQLRVTLTPAEEQAEIVSIINIDNSHDPRVRTSPPFLIDPDEDCFDGPDDDLSAYTFGGSDGAAAEEARYSIVGEDGDKRIRRVSNGPAKTGGFAALSAAGLPRTFLVIGQTLISDEFVGDAWDQHWGNFIVDALVYPGVGGYFDGDSYAALVGQRGTIIGALRGWLGHFTETAGEGDTLLWWLNDRHGCADLGASRSISRFGPGGSPVSFAEIAGGDWNNSVDRFQQWVRNPWTAEPWYTHVLMVEALGNPVATSFSARVRYMMHGPTADRRAGWDYDSLVPEFEWPCGGVGYHTLDNLESVLANVTEFRGLSVLPLLFGPCGEDPEPVPDEECESPWVDKEIPLCQGPWADKEIPEPGEPWLARIAATGDWTLREI